MKPADYDAWYSAPRGAWIGEQEFRLLRAMLGPRPGEPLLAVGCGTGYFTRRFAADGECRVTGLDIDCSWAGYAASQSAGNEAYVCGTAIELPFRNGTFDLAISVAALCFVTDQRRGIQEILRVTKRRFAIGLLHRRSLLYWQKGRSGGKGAYRGARWHTESEIRELFAGCQSSGARCGGAAGWWRFCAVHGAAAISVVAVCIVYCRRMGRGPAIQLTTALRRFGLLSNLTIRSKPQTSSETLRIEYLPPMLGEAGISRPQTCLPRGITQP